MGGSYLAFLNDEENTNIPVNQKKAILDFITADIVGIEDTAYYKRNDVEACADTLWSMSFFTSSLNPLLYDLKPDSKYIAI